MAKLNNLLMRKSSGKLAGATIYTTEGVTIMREVNDHPKNPRTDAQMAQRTKLANLVNFYQALQPYWKKAFEKKDKLNSDYNRFVQLNLTNSPVYLTKQQAQDNVVIPANYVISQGSLAVAPEFSNQVGSVTFLSGQFTGGTSNMTVAALSAALVAGNAGFEYGDQLTFIVVASDSKLILLREITLSSTDTSTVASKLSNLLEVTTSAITGDWDGELVGVACVVSRMVAGKLQVSSAIMDSDVDTQGEAYISDAAKAAAIKSYGGEGKVFLTPGE